MIQIKIFWILFVVLLLHTILTHLLNWLFRTTMDESNSDGAFFVSILNFIEFVLVLALLNYLI